MKICKKCETSNRDTALYCAACGASDLAMQCEKCGAIVFGAFCDQCGTKAPAAKTPDMPDSSAIPSLDGSAQTGSVYTAQAMQETTSPSEPHKDTASKAAAEATGKPNPKGYGWSTALITVGGLILFGELSHACSTHAMGKSTDFNILTAIFIAVGLILVSVGIFVRNVLELRAEQRAAQNQRATTPGTLTTKAKQTSKRNKAWIAFSIAIVALVTLLLALFLTSFARNNRARALTNEEIQAQVVAGFEAGMADAGFSFDYEFVVTDDHCLFAFVAPPGSLHDLASNWNSPAMKRNWQLLVTGAAQQSHDTYEEFKEMGIERDFIFAILSDADRDSYLLVCTNGIVTYNIMDSWG